MCNRTMKRSDVNISRVTETDKSCSQRFAHRCCIGQLQTSAQSETMMRRAGLIAQLMPCRHEPRAAHLHAASAAAAANRLQAVGSSAAHRRPTERAE